MYSEDGEDISDEYGADAVNESERQKNLEDMRADLSEVGGTVDGVHTDLWVGVVGSTVIFNATIHDGEGGSPLPAMSLGMTPSRALIIGSRLIAAANTAAMKIAEREFAAENTAAAVEDFLRQHPQPESQPEPPEDDNATPA